MIEHAASPLVEDDGAPDLVIRSIADLMTVLRGSDMIMRVALLRQIAQEPQAVLSFGRFIDNYDVVDELVHQSYQNASVTYYKILLVALAAFGSDPRAIAVLKKAFLISRQTEVVELAAKLLSNNAPTAETQEAMRSVLHQNHSDRHARCAAMVLAVHRTDAPISPSERVRLLLLAPATNPVRPALCLEDLQFQNEWLVELDGPYAPEARVQLEHLGEAAVALLAESWAGLSEENRGWLLLWGARNAPLRVLPRLETVLNGTSGKEETTPLLLAAIEAVVALGPAGALLTPKLDRFLAPDVDPVLRRAALLAGASVAFVEQWREMARADPDQTVRLLSLSRYANKAGSEALPDLLDWIQSDAWDVRAVSADALAELPSELVIPQMRPLMASTDKAIRVAAANVLVAHGDEDWLEDTFIG